MAGPEVLLAMTVLLLLGMFVASRWFQRSVLGVGKKKCPNCAERIQADAKFCRYCGRAVT